jgi:hypothetical protein
LESLKERDHFADIGINGRMLIKMYVKEIGCADRTEFSCLRIGTSGGLMPTW